MAEHAHEDLRKLFDRALATPRDQRAALLDRECGSNPALRRRIEAMLAAAEDELGFLSSPTGDSSQAGVDVGNAAMVGRSDSDAAGETLDAPGTSSSAKTGDAPLREAPGTKIGPYKLLQQIGEGGFGSVFMAEQEKPVARKVALKIIKLGMDTRQVVARFEQERQALAVLDHPNIAKVFDAGATETGRPYFAMELVKGEPIVAYCDRHKLAIPQRLELFEEVCRAVQHAHNKGIIHRDIKPSNVLVCTQDGRPHAKVIDFGVAKATAAKLTEKTLFTEHRQLIGTPEYMSPEQAEGSLDIDTRTDVYSLGVLLYELLTGTTPFSGGQLRSAAYAEIQRIIREVEPPKPSTRLSRNTDTLASVAAHRHTDPAKLGSIVRGELDWIVMKALEKDRSRRYETATGLAMDVRLYLSGEAVLAAPPSRAYRIRTFVRRHHRSVVIASVAGVTLILGALGTTYGMIQARRAADRATEHANREKDQRQRADNILGYFTEVLASGNPWSSASTGDPVEMFMTASSGVESRFKNDPLSAAAVRETIASAFVGLGRFREAIDEVNLALASLRASGGDHRELQGRLLLLRSSAHSDLFEWLNADADGEAALSLLAHSGQGDPRHQAELKWKYGVALSKSPRHEAKSRELMSEAIEAMKQHPPEQVGSRAADAERMAWYCASMNRPSDSIPYYRLAIELRSRELGDRHPRVALLMHNLSIRIPDDQEALALLNGALDIYTQTLGPDHLQTMNVIGGLGRRLTVMGRFGEAEDRLRQVLVYREKKFGPDSERVARLLIVLVDCLLAQNRVDEALALQKRVVANYDATIGPCAALAAELVVLAKVAGDAHEGEAEAAAIDRLESVLTLIAGDADAELLHRAASVILESDLARPRDLARALEWATAASQRGRVARSVRLWALLDTLARVQHRTGDSAAAVETQRLAISNLPKGGAERTSMDNRLAEYEAAAKGGPP